MKYEQKLECLEEENWRENKKKVTRGVNNESRRTRETVKQKQRNNYFLNPFLFRYETILLASLSSAISCGVCPEGETDEMSQLFSKRKTKTESLSCSADKWSAVLPSWLGKGRSRLIPHERIDNTV